MKNPVADSIAPIIGIHHVSLLVADKDRSLTFYCDLLGLGKDLNRPDLGYPGAWLWLGRQQLHLMELPDPEIGSRRPAHGGRDRHVALMVRNLDALAQHLDQAQVPCTRSRSGRRALFCRDPDGNALEFVEIA